MFDAGWDSLLRSGLLEAQLWLGLWGYSTKGVGTVKFQGTYNIAREQS